MPFHIWGENIPQTLPCPSLFSGTVLRPLPPVRCVSTQRTTFYNPLPSCCSSRLSPHILAIYPYLGQASPYRMYSYMRQYFQIYQYTHCNAYLRRLQRAYFISYKSFCPFSKKLSAGIVYNYALQYALGKFSKMLCKCL